MLDHPDLAERWPHLQGKLDNLSQEYELIRFWIDSDDPRYHYGRFSEPVQRLIADGAGRYELELPEHRYALTARVGIAAMEVCRPLPFIRQPRPKVGNLVSRGLRGLFGDDEKA